MKTQSRFLKIKVLSGLITLFLLGAIIGSLVTFDVMTRRLEATQTTPNGFTDRWMRLMDYRLDLTDAQKKTIRPFVEEGARAFFEHRESQALHEHLDAADQKIIDHLTETQQDAYRMMIRRRERILDLNQ